jgi:hypothetical protein
LSNRSEPLLNLILKKTLLYVMLPVVLISAGIYGIIDKYDGFRALS